jgi:hypothetical protein
VQFASASLQSIGTSVTLHVPAWQRFTLQKSPAATAHSVPSTHRVGSVHVPVAGSQVPGSQQPPAGVSQATGSVPVQTPFSQRSVRVHAFPSLHAVPSALAADIEQIPVPGSHVPGSWHSSSAVQTTGSEPLHAPPWHRSVCVQAFPSSHGAVFVGFEHSPEAGSQVPAS